MKASNHDIVISKIAEVTHLLSKAEHKYIFVGIEKRELQSILTSAEITLTELRFAIAIMEEK